VNDKDSKLLWEAYQLLGESEGLAAEEALDAILKAWSTFTTKKGGGFDDGGEQPIPLGTPESRTAAHYNANLPIGGGYSDEEITKNQSSIAASSKDMDDLLADFYPILDIILDGTNNNKEVWFQVLQMIEQTEISQMEKHMIRRGMSKVWQDYYIKNLG
jgi:hypothetical protein